MYENMLSQINASKENQLRADALRKSSIGGGATNPGTEMIRRTSLRTEPVNTQQPGSDGQSLGSSFMNGLKQYNQNSGGQITDMLKKWTGGGSAGASVTPSAGGGLMGSGLMGSASGAMPAAANGGASFGLGGSLVGGTGTVGGSTFAAGTGASAAGAGGGAAAGAGGAGGMSAMFSNPWTALAAAILLNETSARKAGRRDENKGKHLQDLITGKVLEQDAEYYGDKVGGPLGKTMKFGGMMGNPEGSLKAVKKLFDFF